MNAKLLQARLSTGFKWHVEAEANYNWIYGKVHKVKWVISGHDYIVKNFLWLFLCSTQQGNHLTTKATRWMLSVFGKTSESEWILKRTENTQKKMGEVFNWQQQVGLQFIRQGNNQCINPAITMQHLSGLKLWLGFYMKIAFSS